MENDPLQAYLEILSPFLGLPLKVDEHGVCSIQLREGLVLRLESPLGGGLHVLSILDTLSASRFREQVFEAALQYNGSFPPPHCSLAFSKALGALLMQLQIPPGLSSERICTLFIEMLDATVFWQDALRAGGPFPKGEQTLPSMHELSRRRR